MTETRPPTSADTLSDLHERVLKAALAVAAIATPAVSLLGVWQLAARGELQWIYTLRFSLALVFPLLFLCRNRFSTPVLTRIFIFLLLSVGFIVQSRGGLTMTSAAVQLMTLILAGLLFGARGVVITLLLSLCSFALAGYLVLSGTVDPIAQAMWNPELPMVWVRNGMIFTLFGGASALAVAYTVRLLEAETNKLRQSLKREQHHRIALEMAEQDREAALKVIEDTRRVEALGRMASGIAHDFNNTLTVILTSAEMAQRDPYLSVRSRKYLSSITSSAVQAAEMTRGLLDMSRRDPGQISVLRADEILNGMTESIFKLLPADIEFFIDETTDAEIEIDRTLLERALFNLVMNARDALEDKGRITIGCRRLKLMSEAGGIKEGPYVQFWVKDNGRGMSEPALGIGLPQIKVLTDAARGKVEIDSEPGMGSRVYLYFPEFTVAEKTARKRRRRRGDKAEPDTGKSILVVEDDLDVLISTTMTLTQAGFTVASAQDTDSALAALRDSEAGFDLLCIDGVIPGTGSATVIEFVNSVFPHTRIVVCSGYIDEELILRGIRTGELAFVRKPFLVDELLDTIKAQLGMSA